MKNALLIVLTAICTAAAVFGAYWYINSRISNSNEDLSCELEAPIEYEVVPELLPNPLEGNLYVIPDNEVVPDSDPEFPGGIPALEDYIKRNRKMPRAARRTGIVGEVQLSFTVTARGEIRDINLLRGLGFGCDEEAIRLISTMPRWKPAEKDGEFITSRFSMPVSFGKDRRYE